MPEVPRMVDLDLKTLREDAEAAIRCPNCKLRCTPDETHVCTCCDDCGCAIYGVPGEPVLALLDELELHRKVVKLAEESRTRHQEDLESYEQDVCRLEAENAKLKGELEATQHGERGVSEIEAMAIERHQAMKVERDQLRDTIEHMDAEGARLTNEVIPRLEDENTKLKAELFNGQRANADNVLGYESDFRKQEDIITSLKAQLEATQNGDLMLHKDQRIADLEARIAELGQRDKWIRRWWEAGFIPNEEALDALDGKTLRCMDD